MASDWQEIRDYMARADVRAAVARQLAEADEEEPQTEQDGRAGA